MGIGDVVEDSIHILKNTYNLIVRNLLIYLNIEETRSNCIFRQILRRVNMKKTCT
jgi:hypothetical protein